MLNSFRSTILPFYSYYISRKKVKLQNIFYILLKFVKVFPSELFSPAIIKAVKGALPHAPLMPAGGVTLENIDLWFDAGAEVIGIGNSLVRGTNTGNYGSIAELTLKFVEKIKKTKRYYGKEAGFIL